VEKKLFSDALVAIARRSRFEDHDAGEGDVIPITWTKAIKQILKTYVLSSHNIDLDCFRDCARAKDPIAYDQNKEEQRQIQAQKSLAARLETFSTRSEVR
jgi:hypothetical protein